MHNINNTNNAQFDDKNPPASPKVFAFVFFAENRYICTVMQGDTATAQAKRAGGRKTVQNDGRRCGDRNRKPIPGFVPNFKPASPIMGCHIANVAMKESESVGAERTFIGTALLRRKIVNSIVRC